LHRDIRNAPAHEPSTDHRDLSNGTSLHRRIVDAGVLLQGGGRKEDFDEAMRGFAHNEFAKGLCLQVGSRVEALVSKRLEYVDDALGGGVMATRLLSRRLSRFLEEHQATEGVFFERERREIGGVESGLSLAV
jgi:hypothetical protein